MGYAMTKQQADDLSVWLFDGFKLLRAWIQSQADSESVPLRAAYGLDPSDQFTGLEIPLKRKRGRPSNADRAAAELQRQRVELTAKANERTTENGETFHCSYCGRVLPTGVEALHTTNCKAAYRGYASHETSPEKG